MNCSESVFLRHRVSLLWTLSFLLLFFTGTLRAQAMMEENFEEVSTSAFLLYAPAFDFGDPIPTRYTCEGRDISPELRWENAPEGTESFALICDDPDAPMGTWVHWVCYNIPKKADKLRAGISRKKILKNGMMNGLNSWSKIGYNGPCPPPGNPHRYFFKLYALDTVLDLPPGASKEELEFAMEGHVLARAEWRGTYQR